MNKKQIKNVKIFLTSVINSKNRTIEEKIKAEYFFNVIDKNYYDLFEDYIIDILKIFIPNDEKYIWNTIINNKKSYDYITIKSFDNSTNKRRINVVTLKLNNDTRNNAIKKANDYLKEKNISLNDIYYYCY